MLARREFFWTPVAAGALPGASSSLIGGIERAVIWEGRRNGPTWFHPRACALPSSRGQVILMTCQTISGSDVFGPVHWSESSDLGRTWSAHRPVPGLGRKRHPDGIEEGVCDVVPEYHAKTGTILAMGHNVYYKDGKLTRPSDERWPVYVVRDSKAQWSPARKLEWIHPEASAIYTCGCAQRLTFPGGEILVPLSFGPLGRIDRAVGTVLCSFDGNQLRVLRNGNILRLSAGRGLLEPSLAQFQGRFYMTIRAENQQGFVTVSKDGLEWEPMKPWCWEDGEPLMMSTTQQRWLPHSDGLFLVYTRKTPQNANVVRWRAPLFLAQVDTKRLVLIRGSEQVVFPLIGDGIKDPKQVALMGNFHTTAVTPELSIVTVGENLAATGWRGDTLLARIRWKVPNRLAG